jgi:hypothetical protein
MRRRRGRYVNPFSAVESHRIHSPRSGFSRPQDSTRMTTATIALILAVSSKEGAVIGAVLSTRKFHRDHHWHQTHMNNCRINEISNKLKQ